MFLLSIAFTSRVISENIYTLLVARATNQILAKLRMNYTRFHFTSEIKAIFNRNI